MSFGKFIFQLSGFSIFSRRGAVGRQSAGNTGNCCRWWHSTEPSEPEFGPRVLKNVSQAGKRGFQTGKYT